MAALTVRSVLANKLHKVSQRENRPLDDVLESLISHYEPLAQNNADTLARLAQQGSEMSFQASENDISTDERDSSQ